MMKTINYGKVNDCILLAAFAGNEHLIPLNKIDQEYITADYCIRYDSGVYPSITDVEQYICDQITAVINSVDPASTLGKLGGSVKSDAKAKSSRANGKKGGRPKKG